jgi:hypothetical protein
MHAVALAIGCAKPIIQVFFCKLKGSVHVAKKGKTANAVM